MDDEAEIRNERFIEAVIQENSHFRSVIAACDQFLVDIEPMTKDQFIDHLKSERALFASRIRFLTERSK